MRAPRISIVLLAVTCLAGCTAPHAHSSVDYNVEFVSKRTDSVDEVQAKLGDSRAAVGIMPSGKHAILALFNEPFSSDAVLYWKKETDGSHWRASVGSLEWSKIAMRDRAGGTLKFVLLDAEVTVSFVAKQGGDYLLGSAIPHGIPTDEAPPFWR